MANISEQIEKFLIATLGENDSIDITRNSLAEYFSCVPSQINYVLETRFTVDRGYIVESKRGGGGFVKISKIKTNDSNDYLNGLFLESVGDELSEKRFSQILDKLVNDNIMSQAERVLIEASLSDDSLSMPFTIRDKVRAKAFKNVILKLMSR
ncbi:MAG: CtsR family transcriptional regulator [Clostridia bacterium]|nr:CtsR family transcriptional regulator [Clostridia bacterium]